MRYIIDCWNLDVIIVPVEEKMRWSETRMSDVVLNLPNLEAGGVVKMYLPNVDYTYLRDSLFRLMSFTL